MKHLLENWREYLAEDKSMDSKQIAKAVIIDGTKVLILKRAPHLEKYAGEWDLPGGHVIEGEENMSGLQREVWEETSLIIKGPTKLYSQGHNTYYKASMPNTGKISLSKEHTDYLLVDKRELDNYELPSKYLNAIKRAFKHE